MTQLVKNPPAMWETWAQYLGWEDPLEKGKITHSSILAWRIPWAEYIYISFFMFFSITGYYKILNIVSEAIQ